MITALLIVPSVGLTGCAPPAASVHTPPRSSPPPPSSETVQTLGSPFADPRDGLANLAFPLILDPTDLAIGTTVQYARVPTESELHDLQSMYALRHVVLGLVEWPSEFAAIEVLNRVPPEVTVTVILAGYPPTRGAAEAWGLLGSRLQLVIVVNTPPPSAAVVADLNAMRALARVIYQTDNPQRYGFERLQRPLTFRTLME